MLHIVNENLFSFNAEDCNNAYGDFTKLSINTSAGIMLKAKESDDYEKSVRTILKLISPDKNYEKFNMAVSTKYMDNGSTHILLKCTPDVQNDSEVYLVAFPFNGLVQPIPVSNQYRILKGMLSLSDQYSITHNGKKFKKILYLAISPRMSLLNPENENHLDKIVIDFNSYTYNKTNQDEDQENDGPKESIHEKMSLVISNKGFYTEWKRDIIPAVDMGQYKGTKLFTTYKRPDVQTQVSDRISTIKHINKPATQAFASAINKVNQNSTYHKDEDDDDDQERNNGKKGNGGKKKKKSRR